MSSSRYLMCTLFVCAVLALGASVGESQTTTEPAPASAAGNTITGDGLPNPTSTVMANWGDLPEGREWGSTAGIDIDPGDGQIWAYERCGAGTFGGGVRINCDSNPVDPDLQVRPPHRGGAGELRRRRHGHAARHPRGCRRQRMGDRLRGEPGGDQGASGPQVQPHGRAADEPRHGGPAGKRPEPAQPADRRGHRAGRQHLRRGRTRRPGHDHRTGDSGGAASRAPPVAS